MKQWGGVFLVLAGVLFVLATIQAIGGSTVDTNSIKLTALYCQALFCLGLALYFQREGEN